MMARADVIIGQVTTLQYDGGGIQYVVQTPSGSLYLLLVDSASDLMYVKSLDRGLSWRPPVLIDADTLVAQSLWYDRWSGLVSDTIHMSWVEAGTDIIHYRSLDTSNDTMGTDTTVADLTSTAAGGCHAICRSRGTNLYISAIIDAGAEGDFYRSVDGGANWTVRATPFEAATQDQIILVPGFATDPEDMMAIFWDASADELSRKIYDDSANSWAETSIATGMVDRVFSTDGPHFAAAVDLANSRIVLVAWSAVDTANADLRCWTITESAITEVTNVVLNSVGNQAYAAIGIDTETGWWHVFYGGATDGSETVTGAGGTLRIYTKVSKDQGLTWGTETSISSMGIQFTNSIITIPRFVGSPVVAWHNNDSRSTMRANVSTIQPFASYGLGL